MPALLIIAIIIGIVLLVTGIVSAALKFLLFIGLVLIVLAVIGWIVRRRRGAGSRVWRRRGEPPVGHGAVESSDYGAIRIAF
jgi:high-affinity Fe2+/Pb2+ permease